MLYTLSVNCPAHYGSQSALHNASDVYDPLQTLVIILSVHKGVCDNPLCLHTGKNVGSKRTDYDPMNSKKSCTRCWYHFCESILLGCPI